MTIPLLKFIIIVDKSGSNRSPVHVYEEVSLPERKPQVVQVLKEENEIDTMTANAAYCLPPSSINMSHCGAYGIHEVH